MRTTEGLEGERRRDGRHDPRLGRASSSSRSSSPRRARWSASPPGARPSASGAAWTRRLAYAFAGLMAAANALMVYALLTHDFTVSYVAQVGRGRCPTWVSFVSLWSSLEGSILFWGLVLGAYIAAAT